MKKMYLAAAVLLLSYGTVHAADEPSLKEGLWSIHDVDTTNPGNKVSDSTHSICRSHAWDQEVQAESKKVMKSCTVLTDTTAGSKRVTEARCQVAGTTITTKAIITSLNENTVHSETHATYSPALGNVSDTTTIQDQKYQGSCPAGISPGDMILPNGTARHLWKH
jgi:hypothetical protein